MDKQEQKILDIWKEDVIRDVKECCKLKELHDFLECYVLDLKGKLNKQEE